MPLKSNQTRIEPEPEPQPESIFPAVFIDVFKQNQRKNKQQLPKNPPQAALSSLQFN